MKLYSYPASHDQANHPRQRHVQIWRPESLMQSEVIYGDFTEHRFAPHEHDTWTIGWVIGGANEFKREKKQFNAPAGTLCVVNPSEMHTGGGRRMSYWCLMPSNALLRMAFPEIEFSALFTTRAVVQDMAALRAARCMFETLLRSGDALACQEATVSALNAVLGSGDSRSVLAHSGDNGTCVARASDYFMQHLDRQVSLSEVSLAIGVSAFHICRQFAAQVGMSPGAFVRSRRVARAQELIRLGRDLSGVAAACGFADQAHMTRLFRSIIGCTPAQWRGID